MSGSMSLHTRIVYHVQLLYILLMCSVAVGVRINPTGFMTTSNERLVKWDKYEIKDGLPRSGANTIETCLSLCKLDTNICVSFTFHGQAQSKCFLHRKSPTTSSPGCSSDSGHLVPLNQEGVVHFKLVTKCYANFPVSSSVLVLSRGDLWRGEGAETQEDCSVLCQLTDTCAVAEWKYLSDAEPVCNLFPRLDTYPECRVNRTAANFTIIAQPCVVTDRFPRYSIVRQGYYDTVFTLHNTITDFLQCRAQCDSDTGCRGFSFDFSYTGGRCRTYGTNVVCNGAIVDEIGENWHTYVKSYACISFSTTRLIPPTTFRTTIRPTHGPPTRFTDYFLMVDLEVRGGELFSTSRSVEDCRTDCNQQSSCRGFNYNNDGRQCYHLNANNICLSPVNHRNSVHYRKKTSSCTWEYRDRSVLGGVYRVLVTDSIRCERVCRLEYECAGFDFDPRSMNCYLHYGNNVCNEKQVLTGVTHYRLKGKICPTETEALEYENTRLVGGTYHGVAGSALACFAMCTAQVGCSGVDYNNDNRGCWFLGMDNICTIPSHDDCCDHLKIPGLCPAIGGVPRPRQAFVDIKSPVNWDIIFATQQCHDDIGTICGVIGTLSTDRSLASLKYMGTMPVDRKVVVRFETVTTGQTQEELLNTRVQDALKSELLKGHSATVSFHTLPPRMEIETMRPTRGPRAGGTVIVFTGRNLDFAEVITIGQTPCVASVVTPTVILCTTARLDNNVLLEANQTVTVSTGGAGALVTSFLFIYVPDPIIISVEPLVTINSGGIFLTVSGISLDTAQTALMTTTVLAKSSGEIRLYNTTCIVDSSNKMRCPTANFNLSPSSGRKRRATLNTVENKDFDIGFVLDGVTEYRNLSGTLLRFSRINVYPDPNVEDFINGKITFVSTWPVSDSVIEFRGDRLTDALQNDDVDIRIGEEKCANVKLFAQRIVCEPPPERPFVRLEDRVSDDRIPVRVIIGNLDFTPGYLEYQQNLLEYPPALYTIIGGTCGLFVLLVLSIILCCCCCGSNSSGSSRRSHSHFESPPPSPQRTRTNSSRYSRERSNGYGPYNSDHRSSSRPKDHYRDKSLSLDTYRENSHRRDHHRENSHRRDDYHDRSHHRDHRRENSRRREHHENSRHSLEAKGPHEYNYPYHERPKSYPNQPHRRGEDDNHFNREYHQTLEDMDDDLDDVYGVVNKPTRQTSTMIHNGRKALNVVNGIAKGAETFAAIADLF